MLAGQNPAGVKAQSRVTEAEPPGSREPGNLHFNKHLK